MGVDAEDLIVRPFREVVERGNEAISNADDADTDDSIEPDIRNDLTRHGRLLVREGERALKRLQPLWYGQVEKYGDTFKDAMLQQDDIERRRREIEDLLYDFEDYIEARSFDAHKFSELQATTRAFALDVINCMRRLQLESPKRATPKDERKPRMSMSETMDKLDKVEKMDKGDKAGKSLFPPLPPLPAASAIPPMPPLPQLPPSVLGDARRSRASPSKQARMSAATTMTMVTTVTNSTSTTDGDDSIVPSSVSTPGMRRASTKSSGATSFTGTDRYQLFHHPEDGHDEASVAPVTNTLAGSSGSSYAPSHGQSAQAQMTLPSATIPRTSAWVRSHQQLKYDSANASTSLGLGPASPGLSSRFNSLHIDTASSSAPSTASATASYLPSSAPTSYTSSPVMPFSAPPLPADLALHAERLNGHRQRISSQSIQDFKLAPSPPVPSISMTLSSKYRPQITEEDEDEELDDSGAMMDSEMDDVEEMLRLQHQSRPGSRINSRRLDWKPPRGSPSPGPGVDRFAGLGRLDAAPHSSSCMQSPQSMPTMSSSVVSEMGDTREIRDYDQDHNLDSNHSHEHNLERSHRRTDSYDSVPTSPPEKPFTHSLLVADDSLAKLTRSNSVADDAATVATGTSEISATRSFVREADCTISPKSTFHQMGGFCRGASLFRSGGHWQGIKQTGGYVANKQALIGRCVDCGYAHNYDEVRLDIERKPEATFTKAGGARFRLRLLYKSHISNNINSARQAESRYACVFCVHAGATVREGDATVFTTPDHLLLHLARHPQPLPLVPGVTVVYGELPVPGTAANGGPSSSVSASTDPRESNDFDLHLVRPPLPTPVPPTVGQTAVATALREHMYRWGGKKLARPPGYTGDMLHFLANARIVGVMFPEKWEGKWCMGGHDGFVGAFPAKAVQIEPPRHNEMPMAGSDSGMSVVARWKWRPDIAVKEASKDRKKDELVDQGTSAWLTFDKGETISNVKCLYADHWCWAGTNSKGRFGMFPQSHILTKTLQQEALAPLRSVKTSGWGAKSLFRGASGHGRVRPVSSSAASSLSNSTGRTRFS